MGYIQIGDKKITKPFKINGKEVKEIMINNKKLTLINDNLNAYAVVSINGSDKWFLYKDKNVLFDNTAKGTPRKLISNTKKMYLITSNGIYDESGNKVITKIGSAVDALLWNDEVFFLGSTSDSQATIVNTKDEVVFTSNDKAFNGANKLSILNDKFIFGVKGLGGFINVVIDQDKKTIFANSKQDVAMISSIISDNKNVLLYVQNLSMQSSLIDLDENEILSTTQWSIGNNNSSFCLFKGQFYFSVFDSKDNQLIVSYNANSKEFNVRYAEIPARLIAANNKTIVFANKGTIYNEKGESKISFDDINGSVSYLTI